MESSSMTETILPSNMNTVIIGPDQRFTIIGDHAPD